MSDYHGHLPEELLIDILSRLPVKPLLRFRCVSKSWRSLISSPSFVNTYLSRMIIATNTSNIDLLLVRHHTQLPDKVEQHYSLVSGNETLSHHVELDFPFRSFNRYFRVVGSCNGLICLSDDLGSVMNTIILWNPTIKKWVTLPLPRFECPDEYSQVLGFGYDPKTNDYKVVRLAYLNWEDSPKVELYSFRKGYWGSISSPLPPPDAIRYLSYPAFVNGAVNWLASEERMYCQLILSFSMEDELFCEIKLPESLVEEFMPDMCIDVFGESLALFHYDIRTTIEVCTIWVMKEYKVVESWTKLFNIVLGESLVFGIRRNSELLLATRDGKVTLYDPKTQQRNDIGLHGTPGSFCVHSYLPSLVLLDEANGVQGAQYVLEGSSEGTSSLGEEGGGNGENTDMEGSNKE